VIFVLSYANTCITVDVWITHCFAFCLFQESFYEREVILADRDMVESESGIKRIKPKLNLISRTLENNLTLLFPD